VEFDSIIGQKDVLNILKNSLMNDMVAHAYAFSGPKGIGKKTVANAFAALLLCESLEDTKACGECMACKTYQNSSNPDVLILDGHDGSIGVDEIRGLQSHIVLRPLYSKRKVYIICDADKMTLQAQNCLLKTLEEPPSYAVIILTVSNYNSLMETIKSRVSRLAFKKYSSKEISDALEAKIGKALDNIDFVVAFSDGIIDTALKIATSEEFIRLREEVFGMIIKINNRKATDIFDMVHFFEVEKQNINIIFDIMIIFYRDMFVYKKTQNENILINSDKKVIILGNIDKFTMKKLSVNIEEIEKTRRILQQNANFQLAMEVMLMKLQEE